MFNYIYTPDIVASLCDNPVVFIFSPYKQNQITTISCVVIMVQTRVHHTPCPPHNLLLPGQFHQRKETLVLTDCTIHRTWFKIQSSVLYIFAFIFDYLTGNSLTHLVWTRDGVHQELHNSLSSFLIKAAHQLSLRPCLQLCTPLAHPLSLDHTHYDVIYMKLNVSEII